MARAQEPHFITSSHLSGVTLRGLGGGDMGHWGMGTWGIGAWGHEHKNHSSSTSLAPLGFDTWGTRRVGASVDPVFNSPSTLSAQTTTSVEHKRACATCQQRQRVPWTVCQRRECVQHKRACATCQQRQQIPWTLSQRRQKRFNPPHPPC